MQLYNTLLQLGYERRKSQEEMFNIINKHLEDNKHFTIMIEAPTGTGKSFGYLLPIIDKGQKAIISTKTKILQEQLRKDLDYLSEINMKFFGKPIKYLILKGKSNYLCLDRFYDAANTLKQKTIIGTYVDFTKEIEDLINLKSWDGDVEFTTLNQETWSNINVDDDYCDTHYRKSCRYASECFYYSKLKKKEITADILVVNHSLLLLKEFQDTEEKILIIDEAHELDEALVSSATIGFSTISILRNISSLNNMLTGESILENLDKDVLNIFKKLFEAYFENSKANSIPLDEPSFVEEILSKIYRPMEEALKTIKNNISNELKNRLEYKTSLNNTIKTLLEYTGIFDKDYINSFGTNYEEPDRLEKEIKMTLIKFKLLQNRISKFYTSLMYMKDKDNKDILGFAVSREQSKQLKDFNYRIEAFPIFPKNVIDLESYKGAILTSATLDEELIELTTGITGDYYKLDTLFDYRHVNFIINNISPKNKELWKQSVQDSFKYLRSLHEKILVLLTSYEQMECIPKEEDIIFQNHIPLRLAVEFIKSGDKNVLVGVDSIWTGLDIKGEKGLLMAKLPFESPSQPLHYHRMKFFEKYHQDGFYYARKKAFIQFKQGFGRLMRSKEDNGTVIICDSRIWKYKEFIDFIKNLNVNIHYRQQRGD